MAASTVTRPVRRASTALPPPELRPRWVGGAWAAWGILALVGMEFASLEVWAWWVAGTAILLASLTAGSFTAFRSQVDRLDLVVGATMYAGVVGLFRLAFGA